MKLVLLPGMDGTGRLFEPLRDRLEFSSAVLSYPPDRPLNYHQLRDYVARRLPSEPFVLLAESFSGPIGIAVAAAQPEHLKGLILCATFARCPRSVYKLAMPFVGVAPARLPQSVLSFLLMGNYATPALKRSLKEALDNVSPSVMRNRMKNVLHADCTDMLTDIRVPCLYMRADSDRIVPPACGNLIAENSAQCRIADFQAHHFLLQCAPKSAAEAIRDFVHSLPPPATDGTFGM